MKEKRIDFIQHSFILPPLSFILALHLTDGTQ